MYTQPLSAGPAASAVAATIAKNWITRFVLTVWGEGYKIFINFREIKLFVLRSQTTKNNEVFIYPYTFQHQTRL